MLRSENAKEKSKAEKGVGECGRGLCSFAWVANAKTHRAKIGNARWA